MEDAPFSPTSEPQRWVPRVQWTPNGSSKVHPEPRAESQVEDLPTLSSYQPGGPDSPRNLAEESAPIKESAAREASSGAGDDGMALPPGSPLPVPWSPQSGTSTPKTASRSRRASIVVMETAKAVSEFFKDDDRVLDKWAAVQGADGTVAIPASARSSATGQLCPRLSGVLDKDGKGGQASQDGQEGAKRSKGSDADLVLKPSALEPLSKHEFRLISANYLQGLLTSAVIAAINVPCVYAWSRLPWHHTNPPDARPVYELNTSVYQLSLLLQCIFPLSLYALVLYACIKGTWRVPRLLVVFVLTVMSIAIMCAVLFWKFNVSFWYYSGDFFYIALTYVPAMCGVGWFLAEDGASTTERLHDMLLVALLETVVAAAAILYCQLLMPLFFMVNAWLQLAWVCLFHPIYFEVTTAVLLRIMLRRNALKGRTDVKWFLSIVHAGVHSVSISCILTSSIDTLSVTVLTQVLCSACKLVWRSTTNLRDTWIERFRRWDFHFQLTFEEQCQQNRLVATGILTEMILENACNIVAPWLIWCTWHTPLFMAVAPSVLVEGGTYPVYYVICLILILVAVTATFDMLFLLINYVTGQRLPVIQTFREIRQAGAWYVGFLAYALTFMGIMFLFITMILVPRAVFCTSNNYCDCHLAPLEGICDGAYISTWGGNII